MAEILDVSRICSLNDSFRRNLSGGVLVMTRGVIALGAERQQEVINAIAAFDDFTPENDPYGEHDFGSLIVNGVRVFFKVDYCDRTLTGHSDDPADATITTRVLTIMLPEEY